MNNIKLKEKQVFSAHYRGISFEIQHWLTPELRAENYFFEEKENWTYYLYIHLDRIPEKFKPNSFWLKRRESKEKDDFYSHHACYDYYGHRIISNIDFHCGITYYSKESGFDGESKIIKIGCDFSHLYDEGKKYSLEYIVEEAKKSIDSFRELVPGYEYRCSGNGKKYDESEGLFNENGDFCSFEYYDDKKYEWFDKLKAKNENSDNRQCNSAKELQPTN